MRSAAIKTLLEGIIASDGVLAYPVMLPQGVKQGLTYMRAGGSSAPTLNTSGMQRMRLQVDCFAQSHLEADALRSQLISGLDGFRGTLIDGTVFTVRAVLCAGRLFREFRAELPVRCRVLLHLQPLARPRTGDPIDSGE